MGTTTKTIKASAGDYSTIASWEGACTTASGTNIWKGVLSDGTKWDESVTWATAETINSGAYMWLTVDDAYKHPGYHDAGKSWLEYSSTAGQVFVIQEDYSRITNLNLSRSSTDYWSALYFDTDCVGILIENCLIWYNNASNGTNDTSGVYIYRADVEISISNSCIYGWRGAGVFVNNASTPLQTATVNIDHCQITHNGSEDNTDCGNLASNNGYASGGDRITWNVYNSVIASLDMNGTPYSYNAEFVCHTDSLANIQFNGSNNIYIGSAEIIDNSAVALTDSTTGWVTATNGHSSGAPSSGAYVVVEGWDTSLPYAGMDLRLKANDYNVALEAATDRIGSEPDSRQDFALDITGATRPTSGVDVGPHQLSTVAGGVLPIMQQMLRR